MKRSRTWIGFALVGVVAAGAGFVARGALAEDEKPAEMPQEKAIDGHALVKALSGTWTTKATSTMGDMAGQVTYGLECGKTILASRYQTKGGFGEMHGFGVTKISADGKTATQWWFDSMMPEALVMTGPVTETGFSVEGSNKQGASKVTLEKKGDGFEMKVFGDGNLFMTETYTKAK